MRVRAKVFVLLLVDWAEKGNASSLLTMPSPRIEVPAKLSMTRFHGTRDLYNNMRNRVFGLDQAVVRRHW
jgi:hypothetical protein